MSIKVRRRGWVQIVEVSDENPVRERIEGLIDRGESLIVVDLTRKRDVDSVFMGQLVACREHARRHDGVIKLVVTAGQRDLLVATKLDYLFQTFRSEDEAMDSFESRDTTVGIP